MLIPFTNKEITFRDKDVKPILKEIAVTESHLYKNLSFHDFNPDALVQKKGGLHVYDEMRHDDAVKFSLNLKKLAVLAPGWMIEPPEDDPDDTKGMAKFVEMNFLKMKGTLSNVIKEILTAMDYGYSITEKNWKIVEDGEFAGKLAYKSLKTKRPHFYDFDTDEFGNLMPDGIVNTTFFDVTNTDGQRLPTRKFVIYTYQKEFSNWYGISDLRAAYRHWWSKDNIIKFWNIYLEKFGSPTVLGKHKTTDKTQVSNLETIVKNLQNSTSAVFPEGNYDISFLEPQRRSSSDYEASLKFHNRAIARALLTPDKLAEGGEVGAFALSQTHFNIFLWFVNELQAEIEEAVMDEQIIRPLIAVNFGHQEHLPTFKFKPLTEEQKLELAKLFTDAVQKGAITPNFEDQAHLRDVLDFPKAPDVEQPPGEGGFSPPLPPSSTLPEDEIVVENQSKPYYKYNKDDFFKAIDRKKTEPEKRVNFQAIDNGQKEIEVKTVDAMQGLLAKQRDALIKQVAKMQSKNELSIAFVNSLDLRFTKDLMKAFNASANASYSDGISSGKSELPKKFANVKNRQGMAVVPQKALDYLEGKSNFLVKEMEAPLVRESKSVLYNTIRTGASVKQTTAALTAAYAPYLSDGEIKVDDKQLKPFRLEAEVRTSLSEAFNYGRRAVGEDPDVKDFVIGYQFSEILDDRTVEVSLKADGLNIAIDDPRLDELSYPLHWNDRGLLVFLTTDDKPIEFDNAALDELATLVRETKP